MKILLGTQDGESFQGISLYYNFTCFLFLYFYM